ncbi:Maturation and nuclear export of 40S ribosomal subunits interacting protein [Malassezia vespertilionis]|uniref:CCAAT-binding factor domain-containing protein n=1 Tax=Malassezia vespertilionis TaxID=2020962 RepID=A0A2N1J9I1_9BASI|nr:Maturation and nuclear export of 40S ribosomal subunits interacting protein [Malassezia vespertilionis]PKI83142.1 hypothetical protein MVES_002898 [Malassezia vespertilionis]WFD07687.1 Maturation and nuclear export of 40S ribosomal subunits interacting protein [Malassezia vespertilionis]
MAAKKDSQGAVLERVKALQERLASSTNMNPISELIGIAKRLGELRELAKPEAKAVMLAARIVGQSLATLCANGAVDIGNVEDTGYLSLSASRADPHAQVARWLKEQWNAFVDLTVHTLFSSGNASVRLSALEIIMKLQVAASEALGADAEKNGTSRGRWSTSPFRAIVRTFLFRTVPQDVLDAFAEDYLEVYDDVRFAFAKELGALLHRVPDATGTNAHVRSRAYAILRRITAIPTKEAHLNNFLTPHLAKAPETKKRKSKKRVFQEDGADSDEEANAEREADQAANWLSDSEEEEAQPTATATAASVNVVRRGRRAGSLLDALHSLLQQRHAFGHAWLSLLLPTTQGTATRGGALSLAETHDVLVRLHSQILPHLAKPTMLHDFLVDCLDTGGTTALLALNGLYTLIVVHNLDYPAFYTRLYALLDASVMHTKYRSRFMRMLDTFLSSSHLPVTIVASFVKRLSRLSLRATPAAIVEIVPFVWNLLRRHPGCMPMIHREWNGDHLALGPSGVQDTFDAHEPNPLHTGALESSLWEIAAFGPYHLSESGQEQSVGKGGDTHYLGSVTTFSSILAEPFTKQRYDLEEFLDTTYGTLFETEANKTLKRKERPNKAPPRPAVAPLDITLSVPPMMPGKLGTVEQATRKETRKRLRRYAFPGAHDTDTDTDSTALVQSRKGMELDAPAALFDFV